MSRDLNDRIQDHESHVYRKTSFAKGITDKHDHLSLSTESLLFSQSETIRSHRISKAQDSAC